MSERRTVILDGALRVLAAQGMRGLTHRAVDAAAGLPAGSTSYYFRTRSALVAGCVTRLLELDFDDAGEAGPSDPEQLLELSVRFGVAMVTGMRSRTLARYELNLAALRDPELRDHLVRGGDLLRARMADLFAGCGVAEPAAAAAELAAVLDGLAFTALLRGPHDPDALAGWMRPALARVLDARRAPGRAPRPAGAPPGR